MTGKRDSAWHEARHRCSRGRAQGSEALPEDPLRVLLALRTGRSRHLDAVDPDRIARTARRVHRQQPQHREEHRRFQCRHPSQPQPGHASVAHRPVRRDPEHPLHLHHERHRTSSSPTPSFPASRTRSWRATRPRPKRWSGASREWATSSRSAARSCPAWRARCMWEWTLELLGTQDPAVPWAGSSSSCCASSSWWAFWPRSGW